MLTGKLTSRRKFEQVKMSDINCCCGLYMRGKEPVQGNHIDCISYMTESRSHGKYE